MEPHRTGLGSVSFLSQGFFICRVAKRFVYINDASQLFPQKAVFHFVSLKGAKQVSWGKATSRHATLQGQPIKNFALKFTKTFYSRQQSYVRCFGPFARNRQSVTRSKSDLYLEYRPKSVDKSSQSLRVTISAAYVRFFGPFARNRQSVTRSTIDLYLEYRRNIKF